VLIQAPTFHPSVICFKTASNHESLFGEDVQFLIWDEFTRCDEKAWFALRSTLTATRAQAIMIGNANGEGWHKDMCLYARDSGDTEWQYFQINCYDAVKAGILEEAEILQAKKDLPAHEFRKIYEADIDGERPGALWTKEMVQECRVEEVPNLREIIICVDPSVGDRPDPTKLDECGILVMGIGYDLHLYVLEDMTLYAVPAVWAATIVNRYAKKDITRVLYEQNQGGGVIAELLRQQSPSMAVHGKSVRTSKHSRALPIVALYQQGLVHHVTTGLGKLEGQITTWTPLDRYSHGRLDALTLGVQYLSDRYGLAKKKSSGGGY